MRINFKEIEVQDLTGEKMEVDASQALGNSIYQLTADLGMLKVAQEIYSNGEAELDLETRQTIISILQAKRCVIFAMVKKELIKILSQEEPQPKETTSK